MTAKNSTETPFEKGEVIEEEYAPPKDSDSLSINDAARGDNLPDNYFLSVSFIGTLIGLCLAQIAAYIFLILPTNVLTFIDEDIGPSKNISWVNIARTLAESTMFLVSGRLSDLFGRRWFFIGGNCVCLIGVIVGACAKNVDSLIVASAVYGLGECIQLSFGVAIGELVKNKHRPMVMSFIFATSAPIATFGPKIARAFVLNPSLGWRWTYYLNIIVIGVAIILLFFCYHPPNFRMLHEHKSKKQQMKELDYPGIFLWAAGLVLFLMGISWGGGLYPWKSASVICTIVIGAMCLIAFGFWEAYGNTRYPLMPMKFFRNRGFISLVACATVASMFYYSAVLLWPQQVSTMYTSDINYAGWLSCTVSAATALGQVAAGGIIKIFGGTRYWLIISAFGMVAFVSACASLTPSTKSMGIAFTILGPFFVGFIELAALSLAPLFCKAEDIGLSSGMLASIRAAGGSIAVAVYTTVLTNRLSTTIASVVGGAAVNAGLPESELPEVLAAISAGTVAEVPGITQPILAAITSAVPTAYGQSFKTVYLASLGFGGIAIVGSLLTVDPKKHLTDKVERRMHGKAIGGNIEKVKQIAEV
ncbi:fungal trichothecene efflux pump [Lindgomyces ingoldianus]|uniref:Fungal trichothecene efflux pump n=1 Tax=Lindgomyces ingoldianus TaxID=673940 RepID=A0ACB6RDW6_9PLEO|nr:fungal trichothecene efflux pump [Lindgomyces ingoldianus]KAF2476712.1 fungal trichothecene efflux pump [Lindgomyces ingoldianus]